MNKTDCWEEKRHDKKIRQWFLQQLEYFEAEYRVDIHHYYMSIMKDKDEDSEYAKLRELLVRVGQEYKESRE